VNHCPSVVIEIDLFSPTSAKTSARCQLVGAGRNVFIVFRHGVSSSRLGIRLSILTIITKHCSTR
jgi:hypothetical protein